MTAAVDATSLDSEPDPEQKDDSSLSGPSDEDQTDDTDLAVPAASTRTSSKRDPITILHSLTGVRTEDLSYFAATPEQWMADVTYVEFWLDAAPVSDDPDLQAAVTQAGAALQAAGTTLHDTCSIALMSRVTWRDRSQVISPIDASCIRANIPVLLPIPSSLSGNTDLGIVCIDQTGAAAFLDSERVTIGGIEYLRFENNHLPAVYGFVS